MTEAHYLSNHVKVGCEAVEHFPEICHNVGGSSGNRHDLVPHNKGSAEQILPVFDRLFSKAIPSVGADRLPSGIGMVLEFGSVFFRDALGYMLRALTGSRVTTDGSGIDSPCLARGRRSARVATHWRRNLEFAAAIDQNISEIQTRVRRSGFGRRDKRLARLTKRLNQIDRVMAARGEEMLDPKSAKAEAAGAAEGLLIRVPKSVTHSYAPKPNEDGGVD